MKASQTTRPYSARRRRAMRRAAEAKVDALLLSKAEDVSYLTGFGGEESFLLLLKDRSVLIADGRYRQWARRDCPEIEVLEITESAFGTIAQALKGRRVRRLGIQSEHVTLAWQERLARAVGWRRIKPVKGIPAEMRRVKDAGEVRAIQRAVRIAERAFGRLLGKGARGFVGRSEREVAGELDYFMRLAGADRPAFETIVAAGPGSSMPHYRPGPARIKRGQAVLIDWGARVGGYCSDLTRTVFVGKIPPKLGEVYEVVLEAQSAGMSACRPGVLCRSADAAARSVVAEAGYGESFIHSLGHGIGRSVHEPPALWRKAEDRLRSGIVVTVEPGIYLPGVGGVRIEDDILITPDGHRRLSRLPRTLAAMSLR